MQSNRSRIKVFFHNLVFGYVDTRIKFYTYLQQLHKYKMLQKYTCTTLIVIPPVNAKKD